MKRRLWIASVIVAFVLLFVLAVQPLAAQTPPDEPWIDLFLVPPDDEYSCQYLEGSVTPIGRLTMAGCFDYAGVAPGLPPGDAMGIKYCTTGNAAGYASAAFVAYRMEFTSNIFHEAYLTPFAFGETYGPLYTDYSAYNEEFFQVGTLASIEDVGFPELGFILQTYDVYETGTLSFDYTLCAGWIAALDDPEATPTPALTPTPGIPSSVDYGQIGQIIDIDLGLGIVEKLVNYIGAANIRDYIALAFALAALVALFKAPSTPAA